MGASAGRSDSIEGTGKAAMGDVSSVQGGRPLSIREIFGGGMDAASGSVIEILLEVDGVEKVVWFRCASRRLVISGEAMAAALFLPALVRGETVVCPMAVDEGFAAGLTRLEATFGKWCGVRHRGRVCAPTEHRAERPVGSKTAAFFTGGVDSCDTLLFEGRRLDALVYVHGFDIALADTALRAEVCESLRTAAVEAGKDLIEIETNLRDFIEECGCAWLWAHGACLAAVAHLLAEDFGRVLISSTQSLEAPDPWGSHPESDPLWSSARMRIEHVGGQRTREQKVEAIAGMALARRHLRVCYENRNGAYNCGRCEKCVRTIVALEVVGVLDRFGTMPGPLRLLRLIRLELPDEDRLWLLDQSRKFAYQKRARWSLRVALWVCRRQWLSRGWLLAGRRWYARWAKPRQNRWESSVGARRGQAQSSCSVLSPGAPAPESSRPFKPKL
jgi:hypothetical protein